MPNNNTKKVSRSINKYIVPNIYIDITKDGEFGNSMLLFAKIFDKKEDFQEEPEDYESDLLFMTRKDFNDSMIYTFTYSKNTSVVNMSSLVNGKNFVSIKTFSPAIWGKPQNEQIKELKEVKEKLIAEMLGESTIVSDLPRLKAVLQRPFVHLDDDKVYYKKISSSLIVKATENM